MRCSGPGLSKRTRGLGDIYRTRGCRHVGVVIVSSGSRLLDGEGASIGKAFYCGEDSESRGALVIESDRPQNLMKNWPIVRTTGEAPRVCQCS